MARTDREKWISIITYSVIIVMIGVLVWLVTWQPVPASTPAATATAEVRTVEDTLDATGVTSTHVIDDAEQKVIQVYVDEYAVNDLAVDQAVAVTIAALDDDEGTGKIYTIADQPRLTGDTTEYEVIIQFDTVPDHLRNGMHADITMVLTSAENVLAVPNGSVYSNNDNYYVDRVTEERRVELPRLGIQRSDVTTSPIKVDIGLEGDDYTEITSGLNAGDKVAIQ